MKQYFSSKHKLDVIPPCKLYPWEEPVTEIFEGTWVISEEDYVMINDK